MSDLMREQFDAWHKSELAKLIAAKEVEAARHMQGLKGSLFCAWEASRAALVVELPEPIRPPKLDDYDFRKESSTYKLDCAAHDASARAVRLCRKALTKAGVTAK